jgi:tetratricopeptide (TPR) repeat protein
MAAGRRHPGDGGADQDGGLGGNGDHADGDGNVENPFGPGFDEPGDRDESAYDLLVRGQALLRDRHNAQAAVVLERAARVEPGKGSILEALGRAYFNSGQHGRAAETFEALLDVDPSAHYGHFALGLSFARLGRDQDARKHLRLAVALDPSSETYRKALEKAESKTP